MSKCDCGATLIILYRRGYNNKKRTWIKQCCLCPKCNQFYDLGGVKK